MSHLNVTLANCVCVRATNIYKNRRKYHVHDLNIFFLFVDNDQKIVSQLNHNHRNIFVPLFNDRKSWDLIYVDVLSQLKCAES